MTFSQVCHTLTAMLRNTISFYNCPCIILYLKWFDIKNWNIEDGEASEQLHQKRNSFYLKITLEVSFFFSFEKKEFHKASTDDFKSSVYSFSKIIFLTTKNTEGRELSLSRKSCSSKVTCSKSSQFLHRDSQGSSLTEPL